MENLLKLPFALRFSLFLAIIALFLSFLLGIVSGIDIGTVMLRTLIFSTIFFGLGYGASFVLQRFIPEIYTVVSSAPEGQQNDFAETTVVPDDGGTETATGYESAESEEMMQGEGAPVFDAGLDESPMATQPRAKMGKHILEEKGFKYEPKIMAEAIRTMMSRDDS